MLQGDDFSDGESDDNIDETIDTEEEYSEDEKKLLNKARQKKVPENYDSENEVIEFSNDEDEEKDSMESDIEGLGDNFDLPNEKAWGKKKKVYYSTDYVDPDYSTANEKDITTAEIEEQEAKNLQKRLAEELDEADFGLDFVITQDDSTEDKGSEKIKADFSKLSKRQKKELLQKESPEFLLLVKDFQERLDEAKNVLGPFLNFVKEKKCENSAAIDYLQVKYDLLLHYCTNICFYIMLKVKGESSAFHPVIKRLAQYRHMITQLENKIDFSDKIKEIMEANESGQVVYVPIKSSKIAIKNKEIQRTKDFIKNHNEQIMERNSSSDEDSNKPDLEKLEDENIESQINNTETEKRSITYQMAKNRGLTPYRKKELSNPRVKHRNKYRKAKIRRRGAVREVRKETTRYAGEISGIKAGVSKSIKLG